jgi:hypothetical protein
MCRVLKRAEMEMKMNLEDENHWDRGNTCDFFPVGITGRRGIGIKHREMFRQTGLTRHGQDGACGNETLKRTGKKRARLITDPPD